MVMQILPRPEASYTSASFFAAAVSELNPSHSLAAAVSHLSPYHSLTIAANSAKTPFWAQKKSAGVSSALNSLCFIYSEPLLTALL